ncbi:MAG: arsenic efflux protein [Spirochaetes bacterium]|nr:arsenic efflux protein [Spirochaetota bacterium]
MTEPLIHSLKNGIMITFFVFMMMMMIDYLSVLTKGKMDRLIKGGKFRQYFMASFLGATPGCLGAFMNVSFYIRGLLTFGALLGGMIATSGDEAFIMLSLFPGKALLLISILFMIGILSAIIIDKLLPALKIKLSRECQFSGIHKEDTCRCFNIKEVIGQIKRISFVRLLLMVMIASAVYAVFKGFIGHDNEWGWERITFLVLSGLAGFIVITVPDHFLEEHIWNHIVKKHIGKIFLWSFSAILLVELGLKFLDLEAFLSSNMVLVLLIAGLVGIIPQSGPHMIFIMMFSRGLIPFSVLLTSSIIQNGHGMLPLLSYSIKDSLLIKLINFIIGIGIGYIVLLLGY